MNQYQLKKILRYHPSTGHIYRLKTISNRVRGSIAGTVWKNGYRVITIDRKHYKAHRLIWFYMTGKWPHIVDHINLDKTDNRWCNLRECTQAQNQYNSKARNKLGVKGVEIDGRQFRAKATFNKKFYHLGLFPTLEEAANAYKQFARNHHGEYARI
jgi:hypothetical protein